MEIGGLPMSPRMVSLKIADDGFTQDRRCCRLWFRSVDVAVIWWVFFFFFFPLNLGFWFRWDFGGHGGGGGVVMIGLLREGQRLREAGIRMK